jgi:CHAT domain-containing protein
LLLPAHATDPAAAASVSSRLADIKGLLDAGQPKNALSKARALAQDIANVDLPDATRAQVLQLAGKAEYSNGSYDETLRLDQQALALARTANGEGSEEVASIEGDLGVALRHLGKFDEAELTFSAASKKFLAMPHPNDTLFSEVLIDYAILAYDRGDLSKAERLTFDALQRRRAVNPPNQAAIAQALDNYGTILQQEGRLAAASAPLQEALDIRRRTLQPRHPDIAASLNNVGVLEQQRGDFAAAEQHLREAAAIDAETFGKGDPQVLTDLSNLGEVLRSTNRPDEALALESEVLVGREAQVRRLGVETSAALDLAISNGNVGNLLRDLGRGDEATGYYVKALGLDRERAGTSPTADIALDLNNIGEGLREVGDLPGAKSAFEEGLSVTEKVGDSALRLRATLLHNIGVLLAGQNDLANAERRLRAAIEIRRKILPDDHPDTAASLAWLAEILSRAGRDEAVAEARAALSIIEARKARGAIGFSASAVAAEARSVRAVVENILSVFNRSGHRDGPVMDADVADDALGALEIAQSSGTAVVAARAAAALLAADARGAALVRQIEDLRDQREAAARWEALLAAGLDGGSGPPDASSTTDLDKRLNELLSSVPSDLLSLTSPPRLRFADLKPELVSGEGWLGFIIGDTSGTIVLVTAEGVRLRTLPEGRRAIGRRVEELRKELDPVAGRSYDLAASHDLYKLLFGKLNDIAGGLSRLVVVSDGPLESFPLAALVTAIEPGQTDENQAYLHAGWLSDRSVITLTPSFAVALTSKRSRPPAPNRADFIGYGDPVLGPPQTVSAAVTEQVYAKLMFLQGTASAIKDVRTLPSLPDTEAQLNTMNILFANGRGVMRTREAATKAAVVGTNLAPFRVIAFATHGLLASESPAGEPALVMTPSSDIDDGLLTDTNIANLKLDADLIVLSACNTAAPRLGYGADGLSGLARAFFYAGARTVLVSHWPVDAKATRKLLGFLASAKGEGVAASFNSASRALRREPGFAHPAFWAPFDLVGQADIRMLP